MKKFFGIETKYQFEWDDPKAIISLLNVALIMIFGLKVSWFGLVIAIVSFIKSMTGNRHINGLLMYFANIVLNSWFMYIYLSGS